MQLDYSYRAQPNRIATHVYSVVLVIITDLFCSVAPVVVIIKFSVPMQASQSRLSTNFLRLRMSVRRTGFPVKEKIFG